MIILAVLVAALLHASWNALIRGAGDKRLYTLLLHTCSAVVGGAGLMITGLPAPESWPFLLASAALHTVYILLLIRAYDGGQLATSYTLMRGFPPLIVTLLSGPVLGEMLGWQAAAGIALISLGVIGIGFASGQPVAQIIRHPSTRAALLNAMFIAAYTMVDGQGARQSGNPLAYVFSLSLLEQLLVLALALRRDRPALGRYFIAHWPLGLLGSVTSMLAYGIVLWAMTQAPIAMVAALRESSVIFAVLIGALWFKEGRLRPGIIAALVVVAGISLLRL